MRWCQDRFRCGAQLSAPLVHELYQVLDRAEQKIGSLEIELKILRGGGAHGDDAQV